MNKRMVRCAMTILFILVGSALTAAQPRSASAGSLFGAPTTSVQLDYAPGELIVKLKSGVSVDPASRQSSSPSINNTIRNVPIKTFEPLFAASGTSRRPSPLALNQYYFVKIPATVDINAFANLLSQSPDVEFAIPNHLLHADVTPNDGSFSNQWALNDSANAKLHVQHAWDITTGSSDIVVAVLDTGFDTTHPDLVGKNTGTGYDFVNSDFGIQDDQGHGTAVSGLIAATSNNGQGVAGMSWGATIMPVKVLDSTGHGSIANIARGVNWATTQGAKIINMSLGGQASAQDRDTLQAAVDAAYSANIVVIVSAGNDREFLDPNDSTYYLPAELNHVITVGATNANDEDCYPNVLGVASNCGWYGNKGTGYGPKLDVMAPGSADLWTTKLGGGYWTDFGGTSAAAPLVSGLAALILSANRNFSPDDVKNNIEQNALHLDPYAERVPNWSFGWGRIDAYGSLYAAANSQTCYSLSRFVNPNGAGTISVNPQPNCGNGGFNTGTVVQLTANGNSGYRFRDWSGTQATTNNPTAITMNGNKTMTANFDYVGGGDSTAPTAGWNSPSRNQTITSRSVRLDVWASDNPGGSGVKYVSIAAKYNNQWQGISDIYTPYSGNNYAYDWDLCASQVPDGDIELGLIAYDNAGNSWVYSEHTAQGNIHIAKSYNNCGQSGNSWSVDYWVNRYLAGYVNWHNNEGGEFIFRDWGDGSPGGGIPVNDWSARYVRTVYFPGGDYRFHCQHDDGCRIFIDGQERLNAWWDSSFEGHDWGGTISQGNHEVKVEYYDYQGGARLEAWWQGPGFLPRDSNCDAQQWCAEYWGNPNWSGTPAIRRNEGVTLDRNWGGGGPDPMFPTDNFSGRYVRTVYFPAGQYRFHLTHDDSGNFYIDDSQVIGDSNCCHENTADVYLTEGNHVLKAEVSERGGDANIHLWWDTLALCYGLTTSANPVGTGSVDANPAPNCGTSLYTPGTSVMLTANPNGGSVFTAWTGDAGGSLNPTTILMDNNKNITANFIVCYSLTTSVNPLGSGTVPPNPAPNCNNGTQYTSGTVVNLRANPTSGFTFNNWSGDAGGSANPVSVLIDGGKLVTANFGQPDLVPATLSGYPYPVVPSSITGTHEVNTLYAGQPTYFDWHFINSGSAPATGSFYVELWVDSTRKVRYPYGNWNAGSIGGFDDWSETISTSGWHTVTLVTDPDHAIAESDESNNTWQMQFYWAPPCYSLAPDVVPGGSGSVTASPPPDCNNGTQYTSGTAVQLTANPISGFSFNYWGGDAAGTSNPTTITMSKNQYPVANFAPETVSLTGVWPAAGNGVGQYAFAPGDNIGYIGAVLNTVGVTQTANYSWQVGGDCGTIASWTGDLATAPGASVQDLSSVIPPYACTGSYTYSLTMTYGGVPTTRWTTFTVGLPPANDSVNTPVTVGATPYTITQDTSYATSAANDPVLCAGGRGSASVWYRFAPTNSGILNTNTFGSGYDTVLAIWSGSPGNYVPVACNDDSGGRTTSSLSVALNENTVYFIEIARYAEGFVVNSSARQALMPVEILSALLRRGAKPLPKDVILSPKGGGGILNLHISYSHWNVYLPTLLK